MNTNDVVKTMAGNQKDRCYTDFTEAIRKATQSASEHEIVINDKFLSDVDSCINDIGYLLAMDSKIKLAFNQMENYREFQKVLNDKYKVPSSVLSEAFYELKLGARYEGIRARDVFIIKKAIKEKGTEFPNYTLWSVYKLLPSVTNQKTYTEDLISLGKAIDFLFGRKVDLIYDKIKHKVENEAYVKSVDKIAILSDDIAQVITEYKTAKELDNNPVEFDKEIGLYIQPKGAEKIILRTLNNRVGLVIDDFDLREVY